PRYDPERSARRTDALIAAFGPSPETPAAAAADDAQPLFICGMFRSGSTLLEQVLSRHPQVRAGGELDLLPQLVAQCLQPFPAAAGALSRAQLDALAARYRQHARQVFGDTGAARYLSDKRPDNFLLIGLIKRLFPAARIVHTARDPLDNGLSIFLQQLNPQRFDYAGRLEDIGHFYGEYRRLMAHWTACYPQSLHTFDYDAFVRAPAPTLAALLRFLDLPWAPDCLQFHRAQRAVRTGSYWQVRQPLHADACGRWRHYREPLAPLREALGGDRRAP
ncbi:sulfotransferase, partial [Xanthomonas sp. Kuri4-2]